MLGDTVEATIRADYYFGAPVTNATVKYTVRRTNSADTYFPARPWDWFYGAGYWWWGYDYSWYPGWGRWCLRPFGWFHANPPEVVMENTVPIGKDGTVRVAIDTSIAKDRFGDTDHRYDVTAEVVDESRRTVTGSGSVIAARHPFNVYAWMNGGHFRSGEQMEASFQARTPDGRGVKGNGKATLFRVKFEEDGQPNETAVQTWDLATDDNGQASLTMTAGDPGQYRLAYTVADAKGRSREGATLTRVIARNGSQAGDEFRFDDLELVLDKAEYKPGETARLLINSNHKDGTVVLFVRPVNGVYPQPKVIQLDGKSSVYELDIAKSDMPNIHVEAFTVADGRFYEATREVVVPPVKRMLTIDVEPSEEKYEPGEKAKVNVKLTNADGKPFQGSTVLAIYDKSLEAVASSQVPDIREYFWKWRRNHHRQARVSIHHNFGQLLEHNEISMDNLGSHWTNRWYGRGGVYRRGGIVFAGGVEGVWHEDFGFDFRRNLGDLGRVPMTASLYRWGVPSYAKNPASLFENLSVKTNALQGETGPSVRSRFADTALWIAHVSTDKDGKAEIELDMPENLTTWKIKAWAMGHGTRVGHGEAEVITSKDVLVRLQGPRFFTQKDEVTLSANVHNYTGTAREFDVTLELDGGSLELIDAESNTQAVRVEADQDRRINWKVKAVDEGTAVVRILAKSADGQGDAMEKTYPVYIHGMLKTESWSLAILDGQEKGNLKIEIPTKRRPKQSHLEIRYSPSIALSLVDALPYLAGYPYKNSESAMSRFGPLVITRKILTDLNVDLDAVRDKQINLNPQEIGDAEQRASQWRRHRETNPIFDTVAVEKLIQRSLRDLTGIQNQDGGWGWFAGHDSSAHSTAYVVHGLQIAKQNGAAIVPGILKRGLDWLEQHQNEELKKLQNQQRRVHPWKSRPSNTDAFVFMVLTDADRTNDAMGEFLYKARLHLSPYCQAMLGLTFDKLVDQQKRDMVERNLRQFLQTDEENQTAWLQLRRSGWWHWYGNQIEANAYYLKLLCRMGKGTSASAAGVAKYLLNNRKNSTYWNCTRDTAIAIEALAEYVQASGELDPELNVQILVDGKPQKEVRITKENLFSFDPVVELRGDELSNGTHVVEIRRSGRGNLYANVYLTNFTLEDFITHAGLEIKVRRKYYRVVTSDLTIEAAGSRGNVVDYRIHKDTRVPLENGSELNSGDIVEVELLLESKNDYEYLQFSDRKPAGLEAASLQSGHRWLGGVSAYMELRDEKVDFFVHRLRQGKHSLTYRLRAEVPGRFNALPATGVGVYAPELRANSDEFSLHVEESEKTSR